jgi:hypothetical protein
MNRNLVPLIRRPQPGPASARVGWDITVREWQAH